MQYIVCNTGKTVQAGRIIKVADDRQQTLRTQCSRAFGTVRERINAITGAQPRQCPQCNVAATDNQ